MTEKQRTQIVDTNGVVTHRYKKVASAAASTARVAALPAMPPRGSQPFGVNTEPARERTVLHLADVTRAVMDGGEKGTDALAALLLRIFGIRNPGAAASSPGERP